MRLDPKERQEIWLAGFGAEGACGGRQFYIFSLHLSGTRHLCSSSHFLAAVNIAAVTIGMPMLVQYSAFLSFGFFPTMLLASSHRPSIFLLSRELCLNLESQASDMG